MEEKKNLLEKVKENKWKILTGVGFTTSVILGGMYGIELNKNKQADNTAELVKRVVGGPLIERLITNEELRLARLDNKIEIMLKNNLDEVSKVTVNELKQKRQNILETIADFVSVREALK